MSRVSTDKPQAAPANNSITNAMLAQAAAFTMKGNNTGSAADEADLNIVQVLAMLSLPIGDIQGLKLSNDVTTPNTVLDIASGGAWDVTNSSPMLLSGLVTKNCNAAWVVGNANGALLVGSSLGASTWYHVYLISRSDTGVVDVGIQASGTLSPTLPSGYDRFRRIGSIRTNASSQIIAFVQDRDKFTWKTGFTDVNISNLSTTILNEALTVPPDVNVDALFRGYAYHLTPANGVTLFSPDETGITGYGVPTGAVSLACTVSNILVAALFEIRTDTSRQIKAVAFAASTGLVIYTYGWKDPRGRS